MELRSCKVAELGQASVARCELAMFTRRASENKKEFQSPKKLYRKEKRIS